MSFAPDAGLFELTDPRCQHVPGIDTLVTLARGGHERASQDAENALQETVVSAWPGPEGFKKGFEPPAPTGVVEVTWLEPYPDDLIEAVPDAAPGPDARYGMRECLGLAFIAALQHLPASRRSVLVLRDVLGYRAAEVAEMLNTSEASVDSVLEQARSALEARLGPSRLRAPAPHSSRERELAESFADAFEQGDIDRVVSLLTDDATLTMPPEPFEYQGRDTIASFLHHVAAATAPGHTTKLVPTRANRQPAFGHYIKEPAAAAPRGTGLFVLTVEGDRIAAITRFGGEHLLPRFGLPAELQA